MRWIVCILLACLSMTGVAHADAMRHPEADAAYSAEAQDMKGWMESLYRGSWYDPANEDFRRCVMERESHFDYYASNPVSTAEGAYQFLDGGGGKGTWRNGLVWMMLEESKRTGDGLQSEIRGLLNLRIDQWNRYYQDRSFWTAFRFGKGAKHWYLAGSPCNGMTR